MTVDIYVQCLSGSQRSQDMICNSLLFHSWQPLSCNHTS